MSEQIMRKLEEHDQRFLGIENRLGAVESNANSLMGDFKVLKEDVKTMKVTDRCIVLLENLP